VQDKDGGRIVTTRDLERFLGAMAATRSGATVTAETAMRAAAVYACVRILSHTIGMLPLRLYRRTGDREEIASEHPLDRVLAFKPNRWQTPFELKRLLMGHICLRGNAYAFISRSRGRVMELIPLHPDRMRVEQDDELAITYRYRRADGREERYQQAEIMHLRGLSTDGLMGLSPIAAAREAIGLSLQTEAHGARLFANGARPSGVLKTDQTFKTQEAVDRLRQQFEDRYAGIDNAHRPLILEQGLEWQALSMTATDSQFLEARKFQRSEIAMFYGIPPHMLGDVDKTTSWGTGIEQQGIGYVTYGAQPHMTNIEQAGYRDLLSQLDQYDHFLRFDATPLVRGDAKSRAEALQIMRRNGVVNANEWRRAEGMNPRTDAQGDDYIVEANMTAKPGAKPAPEPTEQPQ
jgi:HK97 family phage portal protein